MDKSWIFTHKLGDSYKRGVEDFLNFSYQKPVEDGKITCPCIWCYNCKYLKKATVRKHLLNHGFDRNYRLWICHGEVDPTSGSAGGSSESALKKDKKVLYGNNSRPPEEPVDPTGLQKPAKGEDKDTEDPFKDFDDTKRITFAYRLYNLKKKNNWSDKSFDHLFSFLKDVFPPLGELPENFDGVSAMMKDLDLESGSDACSCSSSGTSMEPPNGRGKKCCSGECNLNAKANIRKSSYAKAKVRKSSYKSQKDHA